MLKENKYSKKNAHSSGYNIKKTVRSDFREFLIYDQASGKIELLMKKNGVRLGVEYARITCKWVACLFRAT